MIFIIEDKGYDTEKSEKIVGYYKSYPMELLTGYIVYIRRKTTLYRTDKGNWFSVSEGDREKYQGYRETEDSVKELLKQLTERDLYSRYFGELEEA